MPDPLRKSFTTFVVNQTPDGFTTGIQQLEQRDLPPGDVLIQVAYTALNYKDTLVCAAEGKAAQTSPLDDREVLTARNEG